MLIRNTNSFTIDLTDLGNHSPKKASLTSYEDENTELVQQIIKKKPNLLSNVSVGGYTVKEGDTLVNIAESNGISLKRLCTLNNKITNQTISIGEKLIVETATPMNEIEKDIVSLESYFYDYLFNSPIVKLAKSQTGNLEGKTIFREIIFGKPANNTETDPNSLYGKYTNLYLNFHNKKDVSLEDKKKYIEDLMQLSELCEVDLNLNGTVDNIVSFRVYRDYLENGFVKNEKITGIHKVA